MKNQLIVAINQIAAERLLPQMAVLSAIEDALKSAYERDESVGGQAVDVQIDLDSGDVEVRTYREVVTDDDYSDERAMREIRLDDARSKQPDIQLGDHFYTGALEYSQGRIAAQATKQMILQNLSEAERTLVYEQFKDKEGTIVNGKVYRIEQRVVLIEIMEIGRAIATMPPSEQSPAENYRVGQQLKFYVARVAETPRGSEIVVSRSHPEFLRGLFQMEVPEIMSRTVEIKAIAREAGARSKVAVSSSTKDTDAVGTCVGLRGIRIQNIVNELMGEKVDVVEWDEDDATFIMNALNPSSVEKAVLNQSDRSAQAYVPEKSLSLAIGKDGQNARLAAKLTNWSIDVVSAAEEEGEEAPKKEADKAEAAAPKKGAKDAEEAEAPKKKAAAKTAKTAKTAAKTAKAKAKPKAEKKPKADIKALEEELAQLEHAEAEKKPAAEPAARKDDTLDLEAEGILPQRDAAPASTGADAGLTFAEDIREIQQARTKAKTENTGRKKKRGAK